MNNNLVQDIRTDMLAPHSVAAEEAVIGSLLINPECLFEVLAILESPDDFFIVRHGWIYEAILSLRDRKVQFDYLIVVNELEQMARLEEIGGRGYIQTLIGNTPSSLNVEGYATIVKHMAIRRGLIDAASGIARAAHSDETNIDAVVEESETALYAVTRRSVEVEMQSMSDLVNAHWDITSRLLRDDLVVEGTKTGLIDIDRVTGGFHHGELTLIAARPGVGKSGLMQTIAENMGQTGVITGFFSMEMTAEQLTTRAIAADMDEEYEIVRSRNFNQQQLDKYMKSWPKVGSWPIHIDETPALTPSKLRKKVQRAIFDYGIEGIFVDYVQLMSGGRGFKSNERIAELGMISRELKLIAREFNIWVVAGAQLSRAVEQRANKRPLLSDLRESGTLEQDADNVWFIYRDKYYNEFTEAGDTAEIHLAKHRNGNPCTLELIFLGRRIRFVNAVRQHIDLNLHLDQIIEAGRSDEDRKVYGQND